MFANEKDYTFLVCFHINSCRLQEQYCAVNTVCGFLWHSSNWPHLMHKTIRCESFLWGHRQYSTEHNVKQRRDCRHALRCWQRWSGRMRTHVALCRRLPLAVLCDFGIFRLTSNSQSSSPCFLQRRPFFFLIMFSCPENQKTKTKKERME